MNLKRLLNFTKRIKMKPLFPSWLKRTELATSIDYHYIGPSGPLINTIFSRINNIPGSFNVDDLSHFHLVLSLQSLFGIKGDLLEIGSYHGRSAALMANYLKKDEMFHICDAFLILTEDYYRNKPTPEQLINNIKSINDSEIENKIVIHECLSDNLQFDGNHLFRFIHIDGGHSERQALNDLNKVKNCLVNNGIIVVDDYDDKSWPDVTPAVNIFLMENSNYFVLADLNRHGTIGRKIYIMKSN